MKGFNKHQYLSIFYILLGVVLLYLTSQINNLFAVSGEDVGPCFFPYCCAGGMILCGIGKFLSAKKMSGKTFMKDRSGWIRLGLIAGVMLCYTLALNYLGFVISSFIMCIVLTYMLEESGKLKLWKVILFAAIMTVITWFVFVKLIHVMLPVGKWIKPILRMLR